MGVPAKGDTVEAATASVTVGGITLSGENLGSKDYSYDSSTRRISILSDKTIKLSTKSAFENTAYIYIGSSAKNNANLVLDNFKAINTSGPVIQIEDNYAGDVTISLSGNATRNTVISKAYNAMQGNQAPAIQKNGTSGGKLIIKGTGELWAENAEATNGTATGNAAIGGSKGKSSSNIQITGGVITAVSYSTGAAIGGGSGGNGENITITGGDVKAIIKGNSTSDSLGAAIGGGGQAGDGNNITISGGTVYADATGQGTHGGAGIGGGHNGVANNVSISGGTVTAIGGGKGECGAAGIGAGNEDYFLGTNYIKKKDTTITISGGVITATGSGYYGAGIGSGAKDDTNTETKTTVTITGGTIIANGGKDAPGIGAGQRANSTTYISGGSVQANGGATATSSDVYTGDDIGFGEEQVKNSSDYSKVFSYSSTDTSAVSLTTHTLSDKDKFNKGTITLEFKNSDGTAYSHGMKNVTSKDGKLYLYMKSGVTITEKDSGTEEEKTEEDKKEEEKEIVGEEIKVENDVEKGDDVANDSEKYTITDSSSDIGKITYVGPTDKSVTEVTIPTTVVVNGKTYQVTTIAKGAFSGCSKLKKVVISDNITSIGTNAFKGCKYLTNVTIGKNVKTIGNGAFLGCSKLAKVTIPSNSKLNKIGDKAFYKCTKLDKFTVTKNVTTIGKSAFEGCKKLKTITIKSKKLKKVGSKAIKNIHKKATIKCPNKSCVKKYKKLFTSKKGYKKTMKIKK